MKKNIFFSFLLKGLSILVSFLLVPLTLDYLNEYEYGIWLTLNSVLSWVYIFDIGLGNGLRNRLAEALANGNFKLGKIYVSTSFFGMTIIGALIFLMYFSTYNLIDWFKLFNVDPSQSAHLPDIITLVVGIVCVIFIFKLVGSIYLAFQMPAINDLMTLIGSLLSLITIFILTKTTRGSLRDVALAFTASSAVVYISAFIILLFRHRKIAPNIRDIKLSYLKNLMTLGVNFMVIQIAVLVIFMTSNLIISNLFGPAQVTPYNIAFKYFSIITMGFTIIINPIWSAVTDAKSRGDYDWIRNMQKKILRMWLWTVGCLILMVCFSGLFYRIWIGDKVNIPLSLSIWMAIYTAFTTFANLYANIINGFGKVRVQLIYAMFQAAIYIPLAILCGKLFGVTGILIALCGVCSIGVFFNFYQAQKLISQSATGIWSK